MHKDESQNRAIAAATSFTELQKIALKDLGCLPDNAIGICDPISTNPPVPGEASKDMFTIFEKTTEVLIGAGYNVFDERPYLHKLNELKHEWFEQHRSGGHCLAIIDEFYKPLLETKKIGALILLPEVLGSYVSYWEEDFASRNHIKLFTLPNSWNAKYDLALVSGLAVLKQ